MKNVITNKKNHLSCVPEPFFMDVERIDSLLSRIAPDCSIPSEERDRLSSLSFSTIDLAKIQRLQDATEEHGVPLITQLPRMFQRGDEVTPFTLTTLAGLLNELHAHRSDIPAIWVSDFVPPALQNRSFGDQDDLRAYASGPLINSRGGNYTAQRELQARILGSDAGVGIDFVLACILFYLETARAPQATLRLNTTIPPEYLPDRVARQAIVRSVGRFISDEELQSPKRDRPIDISFSDNTFSVAAGYGGPDNHIGISASFSLGVQR